MRGGEKKALTFKAAKESKTLSAYSCKAVSCRKTKSQGTVFYNPTGLQGLPVGLQGLPVSCQSVPLLAGSVSVPGAAGDADQNAHMQAYESVVDAEAGRYQRFYVESLCEIHFVTHL